MIDIIAAFIVAFMVAVSFGVAAGLIFLVIHYYSMGNYFATGIVLFCILWGMMFFIAKTSR